MNKATDMTVGNPAKHIITFAIPLILTNFGQQLYMIADAAIVGRGVGVKALAAVGSTDWCYWMILWTVSGLTQGFSTFVSRYFGEKKYKNMNKVIAMSALLCVAIGVILTTVGLFAARPLLMLLNTPRDILDDSTIYLMTMIAGTLIVTAYNMAGSILRAFGDGKTPLYAMVIAASLNIGLDCVFVFLFQWGIFGAAMASVLAQLISFLFCFLKIRRIEYVHIEGTMWVPDWKLVKELILFGIPIAIQNIIIAFGGILLQSSVNLQGSIFVAGYTATNKVYGLLECSATALGVACCTFFAQNYGAGKFDRLNQGMRITLKIVVAMALTVMSIVLISRRYLLQLFLNTSEAGGPEALETGIRYLTIMIVFLVILYLIHIFRNVLQAMENSFWSMVSGFAELLCRVFMAKVAIHWIGSDALFISEPVAWTGALLCVMLPYFYYKHKVLDVNLK